MGWFSKAIDGVKASEGTVSGLNGRIPQERNPEIILAGFSDWSKADVKSLDHVCLSTVLTGFADTKLYNMLYYIPCLTDRRLSYIMDTRIAWCEEVGITTIYSLSLPHLLFQLCHGSWWPSKIMS